MSNYNKKFNPELTPKQMLKYGVFGGSYLGNTIHEYPKSWFTNAKLSKTFDVKLNYFQIQAGLSKGMETQGLDYGRRSKRLVSVVLSLFNRKKNRENR